MLEMIGKWLDRKALAARLMWAALGAVGIVCAFWLGAMTYFMERLDRASGLRFEATQVLRYALEAEREAADFLIEDTNRKIFLDTGDSVNLQEFRSELALAHKAIDILASHLFNHAQTETVQEIRDSIRQYGEKFGALTGAYQRRGGAEAIEVLLKDLRATQAGVEPRINRLVEQANDATATAQRQLILAALIITGLGYFLLRMILAAFIFRSVTQPLGRVVLCAQGIAKGNLRQEKLVIGTMDEIGELGTVFNSMLDSLRDIASQTRTATETLGAASSQILASTQQQAASTKEQAAAVHETSSTLEQVRQAGHQISEKAKSVATAVEATSSAGNGGLKAVEGTVETMETIREQVEAVAQNIVVLSEKTQAIAEIIQTVNDIAEQSHLLSLNAAIEAAAAGDSGRRFSVVAGEIKNLADQAKESTVQVRSILGDIQKGITGSVMLTEEAVKRVESGRKQSGLAEKTIREFTSATQESVQAFQQILGATNQQQIGYDQVTQALRDILKASEQTAVGTGQLEKGVMNLNAMSQQLSKAVERYQL